MEAGYQYLREHHPEVLNALALSVLCKEIGVPVPEMPSFEEEIIREAMRAPRPSHEERGVAPKLPRDLCVGIPSGNLEEVEERGSGPEIIGQACATAVSKEGGELGTGELLVRI